MEPLSYLVPLLLRQCFWIQVVLPELFNPEMPTPLFDRDSWEQVGNMVLKPQVK